MTAHLGLPGTPAGRQDVDEDVRELAALTLLNAEQASLPYQMRLVRTAVCDKVAYVQAAAVTVLQALSGYLVQASEGWLRGGAVDLALGLWRSWTAPDFIALSGALNACAASGAWPAAVFFVEERGARWWLGGCGSAWQAAFHLLKDLKEMGRASIKSYGSLANVCAKALQWQRAMALLTDLEEEMLQPDLITFGAILSCGSDAEVRGTLRALAQRQLQPDVVAYNAAMKGCSWQMAEQLLREMQQSLVASGFARPNVISFSSAISACEKSGEWQGALSLLRSMGGVLVTANVITYNAAIGSCVRRGHWQHAELLFRELHASGVEADLVSYNSLLSVYTAPVPGRGPGDVEAAKDFAEQLAEGLSSEDVSARWGALKALKALGLDAVEPYSKDLALLLPRSSVCCRECNGRSNGLTVNMLRPCLGVDVGFMLVVLVVDGVGGCFHRDEPHLAVRALDV
eukprot:Skav202152  [mRNA]  locus=scaffold970:170521:184511:- [translate_table: standard]